MKRQALTAFVVMVVSLVLLGVVGDRVVAAQDTGPGKYTVKVPGGLAFSEFKGYRAGRPSPSVIVKRCSP